MSERRNTFKDGADFYAKEIGAFVGGEHTRLANADYLKNVQQEIDNLSEAINKYADNGNPQLKGLVAEAWHTYTFNIDAAAKQSVNRAVQVESNTLGSVDVSTSWGEDYSLKYYKSGSDSAIAQGHSLEYAYQKYIHNLREGASIPTREEYLAMSGIDPKTDMALCMYEGQARLIPSDQIQDAIEALNKKIVKELNNLDNPERSKVAERLIQVKEKLTSHIESPDGASSANLTEAESRELAQLAKEGKFDPERFDITLAKKADFAYLTKNAMNAGLNAAWISALLKIVPELIGSLKKLLKEGYLDSEDLKNIGKAGVNGAKDGFLRGFFCAAISTAAETGLLGQWMNIFFFSVIAASGVAGGLALQAAIPVPIISYAIGSIVGSMLGGLVFSAKEQIMLSLCVKHGYTVFGLVDQDYTMPDSARKKLGFPVFGFDEYKFSEYKFHEYKAIQYKWQEYKWKKLDCVLLKRGVIACRKIAYI